MGGEPTKPERFFMATLISIADNTGSTLNITRPDDGLVVSVNGKHVYETPPAMPAPKTKLEPGDKLPANVGNSVLGALVEAGMFRTVDGMYVAPDGTIITVPDKDEPIPDKFDHSDGRGVARIMEWQLPHSLFVQQVYVDGTKIGYQGTEPGVRYSSTLEPGYLVREFKPAPPVVVTIPTTPGTDISLQHVLKPNTQETLRTVGLTGGATLSLHLVIPQTDFGPGVAYIKIVERPGFPTTGRIVNFGSIRREGGTAPGITFVPNQYTPGTYLLTMSTMGLEPGAPCDVLVDITGPTK